MHFGILFLIADKLVKENRSGEQQRKPTGFWHGGNIGTVKLVAIPDVKVADVHGTVPR